MLRKGMRALLWAHDATTRVAFIAALMALTVLTASYVYEVIARYFFRAPTSWSGDLVGYMLCVSTFMAMPLITQARKHVAVLAVLESAPRPVAHGMQRIVDLIGFLACATAAWFSFGQNTRQFLAGITTLANDPIPKWWVTSVITFGLAMAALHFLRHLCSRDNLEPANLVKLGIHL